MKPQWWVGVVLNWIYGLSYLWIAGLIWYDARVGKRAQDEAVLLYVFILLCGIHHFMVPFTHPHVAFWWSQAIDALGAGVSALSAILLTKASRRAVV